MSLMVKILQIEKNKGREEGKEQGRKGRKQKKKERHRKKERETEIDSKKNKAGYTAIQSLTVGQEQ